MLRSGSIVFLLLVLFAPIAAIAEETAPRKNFLPGVPELSLAASDQDLAVDELSEEEVVQEMYAAAEKLLRGSGHDFQVALHSFETIYREDFGNHETTDHMTLDLGLSLQLSKSNLQSSRAPHEFLHVSAEWQRLNPNLPPDLHDIKLSETVQFVERSARHKADDENLQPVVKAATSYHVELRALGEEASYQAMVFWLLDNDGRTSFSIQDPLIPGMGWLILDTGKKTTPHDNLEDLDKEFPIADPPTEIRRKTHSCAAKNQDGSQGQISGTGNARHASGVTAHRTHIQLGYHETCSTDCSESCTLSGTTRSCADYSPNGPFTQTGISSHQALSSFSARVKSGSEGICAVAQQCAFEQCFVGGGCTGVTVSAQVSILSTGASFSFGNATGAIESFDLSAEHDVLCTREFHEPPEIPPPPCGCCSQTNKTTVLALEGNLAAPKLTDSASTLRRLEVGPAMEDGTQVQYLMEEWAVVSIETDSRKHETGSASGIKVHNHSDPYFAQTRFDEISHAAAETSIHETAPGERRGTFLIFEAPEHPNNSRAIRLPKLRLTDHRIPTASTPGKILTRIYADETGAVRAVGTLHGYDGFTSIFDPPDDLLFFLRTNLEVQYVGQEKHPVVFFAIFQLRGNTVQLLQTEGFLPRCCCGTFFCE